MVHHGNLCLHSHSRAGLMASEGRQLFLKHGQTYHGTQHPGHIDGISPGRAVFVSIGHKFRVGIQDHQTDIQYIWVKLQTDT